MDSNKITVLLDKYWEGETSIEEEKAIRQYFAAFENQPEALPEELRSVQPFFGFIKEEQEAYLNGDFEARLSEQLRQRSQQEVRPAPRRRIIPLLGRVAAVAAIFLCVVLAYRAWDAPTEGLEIAAQEDQLSESEKAEALLAYDEVKSALLLVSNKMNKGTSKAQNGIVQVRKATKVIR